MRERACDGFWYGKRKKNGSKNHVSLTSDYLAGANAAGARFADAQPVVMTHGGPHKLMSVHVPPLRDGSAAPSPPPPPTDPAVSLTAAGGELLAVAKFSGYATPEAVAAARAALQAALAADGVAVDGDGFRVAQYGPLFTLEERTNEIMLKCKL